MTRPRALTSTFRSVIALITALLVVVLGATALPAAALAGNNGQAKGHQADRADKPDKAQQHGRAHATGQTQSSGKTQERDSSTKAQKPATAEKSQSTRGNSAQAHESKASQGAPASTSENKSASKPASTGGAKGGDQGNPPGNNGTVKLAGYNAPNGPGHSSGDGSAKGHPSNDPHLPCGFTVEWFGFDASVYSNVIFEQHAPTRGDGPHPGSDTVKLDDDSHSGGGSAAGFDGAETYNLDFDGTPHAKHGYHVKLTTHTPYSQGADTKHKVFWVEPCERTVTPPGEETPDEETPDEETPDEETPDEETPDEETPDEETPDEDNVQDTVDENGGNSSTVVFGAQASAQNSQGAQAAEQPAAGNAEVPTAIESGLAGDEWSRSVLPLLAVLFGFGTTFVALVRRRARVQAVKHD
jgi:hypothetical protein